MYAVARLVGASMLLVPVTACAQTGPRVRPSQRASVTQSIGATDIQIAYRRPVARGRTLFPDLVPYGKIWTPSADSAVVFVTSTAITVNGSRLAAGSYAVWAIPDSTRWTVIFSRNAHVFHLRYPEGEDALRVQAVVQNGPHMEALLFYFPVVEGAKAELRMHWGSVMIPLSIEGVVP